jgi:hypothetical protein
VKTRTFIITAASSLVLVAPVATAAHKSATPVQKAVQHSTAPHKTAHNAVVTTKARTTPPIIYRAPFGPNPIITPRYIYLPSGTPDPNATPVRSSDCSADPDSDQCTPDEACEYWAQC